jgi:hypothetical protein
MQKQNLSVSEIAAIAGMAITTRTAADTAKAAYDADPEDASLKTAWETAEQAATTAKTEADALSQTPKFTSDQIAKMKRKRAIIDNDLRSAGALDDTDDDDDDDDLDDPNRVVTVGDLQRIEARKAAATAVQMADAIADPVAKAAVKAALGRVQPSGNAEQDFADAVAIANREKNNKVLEELGRRPIPVHHAGGAGAPPRKQDEAFVPTSFEASYMKNFGLTEKDVLEARAQAAIAFPQQ